ncbi:hypothetical protein CAEBREN_18469 [Caenorhabditis brenneri]|uniref:C-type LECtin n=1 Tax=Caenorhabditis brenneri TaxID=135651 RepID=G0MCU8_CAEBE|nr:hypothetical protein CAEBREN_18469 [Caenorhabditis brenneri]
MQLLLTFLFTYVSLVASTSSTPVCTNGFTLINNKCLKLFPDPVTHRVAERTCMNLGATLATVKNANDNQAITTVAGSTTSLMWLGLYCFDNDDTKCIWDDGSGVTNKYNNFANGFPLAIIGKCVYYTTQGVFAGQWLSGDCDTDLHAFVCELPFTFADTCDYNYDGNCYTFHNTLTPFVQAQQACEQECGNLVSITSEMENRYIAIITNRLWGVFGIYLGATWSMYDMFTWVDGSRWNYNRIDRSFIDRPCVALLSGPGQTPSADSWYGVSCTSARYFICKRPAGSQCNSPQPTVTVTPISSSPSYCNSSMLLAPGVITSPNFPNNYDNNVYCTYHLSTIGSYYISLQFLAFSTEADFDRVFVYDGDSTSNTLLATYSGTSAPLLVSSGNSMTVVFKTDRSNVAQGFKARFMSYAR